jgi:negative regulator of flagellin synthesis FlgM
MKIGQPADIPNTAAASVSPAAAKAAQPNNTAAPTSNAASPAGVAVTVSTAARALDQAAKSDVAEVDMDKVNAVRSAIEQGTFKVNPEAIADKLLANAQELLDRTRR